MVLTSELPFVTKTLIPRQRFMVRRERILERMLSRVDIKAQVVCAPAGYGKTALLIQFASETDLPLCWYSFSPEDRDPLALLRYCVHSVRARFPGFGASCISLLRSAQNVDQTTLAGLFTTALHNDLSGRVVFVFDDVHWTDGKKDLAKTLSLLIEHAPANVHFLLGTRTRPSIPYLARLTAQDELDSFDADDLRFSVAETTQLLTHLWRRPVAAHEADAVQDQTRGWAAGIVLLAKSLQPAGGPDFVRATDESVFFDYLTHEVFELLPSLLQVFLLRTSILSEFTTGMCDRLLESSDSNQLIDEVKSRSLFVEERAGEEVAYKYHDLFREFLERRFQTDHSEEYKSLHSRAGNLYSQLGDDDAAIYHFLRGGEPDRAAEIVKEASRIYYDQGRWERLASWLSRIPQTALDEDPDLLLLKGQLLLKLGDPTGSLEQLDKLVFGPFGTDQEVLGKALVAKSEAYRRLGHLDLAVETAEDGLSVLKKADCLQEHAAEAYRQLGSALATQGQHEMGRRYFQAALQLANRENIRLYSLICDGLGVVGLELGELDGAAMYLERARVGWLKLGNEGSLAESLNNLALVYYHKGEFDLALDEIGEALRAAQAGGYPRLVATALENQGMMQRALGAYAESVSSASRALELARELLDQRLIAEATAGLGNAYRKLGETSKAEVLLNQAVLEAEDSGQKYISATYHIALGKVYCRLNSQDLALTHLSRAEEQLTALKSLRRVAEAKLFQAAIYYRADKLKNALSYLSEVADLVSQLGYDGFLLADGDEVLDVLRFGAARRIGGETFARLVGRLTQTPTSEELTNGGQSGAGGLARFPAIRAFSLGHPRVILDSHEVTEAEWQSRKAKELFFFLHCNRRVLTNEEIMDNLWPGVSVDLSSGALRINIYRVRQALFFDCILSTDTGYSINPEVSIELDMGSFLQGLDLATDSSQSDEARERYLESAIELYHGPFLNGIYSEWCQLLRADLEIKYQSALMNLAAYQVNRKNFRRAAGLLETVVTTDPYDEEAQYQLIVSFLEGGEVIVALQHLRKYAKLCLEELGTDLPPRFNECHRRITSLLPSTG